MVGQSRADLDGWLEQRPAPPLSAEHLAHLAQRTFELHAQQPAFTVCLPNGMQGTLSYADLADRVRSLASYLHAVAGIRPGDRVAVLLPNCLAYPVAALAVLRLGAVLVNISAASGPVELSHCLADSNPRALITLDLLLGRLEQATLPAGLQTIVAARLAFGFPRLVAAVVQGILRYWQRAVPGHRLSGVVRLELALAQGREVAPQPPDPPVSAGSPAVLQYTGGTTGVSKAAVLTHGNLLANLAQIRAQAGDRLRPGEERMLSALPLSHAFAFTVNFLLFFSTGCHNILIPDPRPVSNCRRAIENHAPTWVSGVNTLFRALLDEDWFRRYPPRSLRYAVAGGMALDPGVAGRWAATVDCPLVEGYGLTEASPVVSFNPVEAPRSGSVGLPLVGTGVRIVDPEGVVLGVDAVGEVQIRGPQVMAEYWQQPEATRAVFAGDWLRTGDLGRIDADGYLYLVDRLKDLILVSGYNVYPREVETCILELPQVQEVGVVGVTDDRTGERVEAWVVPAPGRRVDAEAIRDHCRGRLAGYKVPQTVHPVDTLPKSALGKVLRRRLREPAEPEGAC